MGILTELYNRDSYTNAEVADAFKQYNAYLHSVENVFPPGALSFAIADWHYNMQDSRCPHDAWVEFLKIYEDASGTRKENRTVNIKLKLLGAFHDGYIELSYRNIADYRITGGGVGGEHGHDGHGDWYVDDFHLSGAGRVVHDILFSRGYIWSIECDDLIYEWLPIATKV